LISILAQISRKNQEKEVFTMPITGGFGVVVTRVKWVDLEKAKEHLEQSKKNEAKRCKELGELIRNATFEQRHEIIKHLEEEVVLWNLEQTQKEHIDAQEACNAYYRKDYSNPLIARYLCFHFVKKIFGKEI